MNAIKIDDDLVQALADLVHEHPGMSVTAHLNEYGTPEMMGFLDMTREDVPVQMEHELVHFEAAARQGLIYLRTVGAEVFAHPAQSCPTCGRTAVHLSGGWFSCQHEDGCGREFHIRGTS